MPPSTVKSCSPTPSVLPKREEGHGAAQGVPDGPGARMLDRACVDDTPSIGCDRHAFRGGADGGTTACESQCERQRREWPPGVSHGDLGGPEGIWIFVAAHLDRQAVAPTGTEARTAR